MTDTTKKYDLISQAKLAKFSSKNLANLSTNEKNSILSKISENLKYYTNEILIENQKDISIAKISEPEFKYERQLVLTPVPQPASRILKAPAGLIDGLIAPMHSE